jgi:hypothetical protein
MGWLMRLFFGSERAFGRAWIRRYRAATDNQNGVEQVTQQVPVTPLNAIQTLLRLSYRYGVRETCKPRIAADGRLQYSTFAPAVAVTRARSPSMFTGSTPRRSFADNDSQQPDAFDFAGVAVGATFTWALVVTSGEYVGALILIAPPQSGP